MEPKTLHPADYAAIVLTLVISMAIGVYYAFTGGRQRTVQEFLLGDRKMGILPVTMSLLASFLSAIGMISVPAEIYLFDAGISYSAIGMCLALPFVASCFLPVFYDLKLTSVYEYLELRFNSTVRKIGSLLFIIQVLIYISFVLYAPSLALSQVTGLDLWGCVLAVGILGTIYTTIGGIKAVMWTDVFQILIMFISLLIVIIKGTNDVGGIENVFKTSYEGGRLRLKYNFDLRERYTIWSISMGSFFYWLSLYGINQTIVQRYLSSPSLLKAQITVFLNIIGNLLFNVCVFLAGLIIYTKYCNCDPWKSGVIKSPDQIFPLFVTESLYVYPGLIGVFVAGIFSGSLSTISSSLNSLAAITLEDFVKCFRRWRKLSSEREALISKILSALYGICCLILVAAVSNLGTIIEASAYCTHTFGGILCGLFTLGMFIPWANSFGAIVGVLSATIFALWTSIGIFKTKKPYTPISHISVSGCAIEPDRIINNVTTTISSIVDSIYNTTTELDIVSIYNITTTTIVDSIYNITTSTIDTFYNVTTTMDNTTMLSIFESTTYSNDIANFTITQSPTEKDVFPLYQISYGWIQLICALPVIIIGLIASLLCKPTKVNHLDLRLLSPVSRYIVQKLWFEKINLEERNKKLDILMQGERD